MLYKIFDTGEIYTEKEFKELFDMFKYELDYENYEEYKEEMLSLGRQRIAGIVELDESEFNKIFELFKNFGYIEEEDADEFYEDLSEIQERLPSFYNMLKNAADR